MSGCPLRYLVRSLKKWDGNAAVVLAVVLSTAKKTGVEMAVRGRGDMSIFEAKKKRYVGEKKRGIKIWRV